MAPPAPDVIIVGAGPTGLTMALELALNNVSFRIIERSTTPSDKSRALVLQSRSLELLRRHGITDAITERCTVGTGARVYVNKQRTVQLSFDDLGFDDATAFPAPTWISQADTEAIMASHLESTYGVKIERGAVADEIAQDESGVDVTITRDGKSERVRCSYVVGCDGAHSTVRRAAGLSFEGAPYPQDFVLCDAHLKWEGAEDAARPISIFLGSTGILIMFPMKEGVVRLIGGRPPEMLKGRGPESDPTLEDFRQLLGDMAPGDFELYDPIWLATFRLHHRGAEKYRNGRLFVAGDAAHIHSPAGGQGMNTGIQDAINLGWKLARVIPEGREGQEALDKGWWLDTYNEERHPVGLKLLTGTDRLFGYISSTGYFWLMWRDFFAKWIFPWLISDRKRRARVFRFITELGIRYRRSPITRASKGTNLVKGGDRAPDGRVRGPNGEEKWLLERCRGDRHHMVMFSGLGARSMEPEEMDSASVQFSEGFAAKGLGETEIHRVYSLDAGDESGLLDLRDGGLHKAYGFDEPGYALIRPDAYVACIGFRSELEDLLGWLNWYYGK